MNSGNEANARIISEMHPSIQVVLRQLTHLTRPIAMRSAGKDGSTTAVVRHVGRRSGRNYETPVVAVEQGDCYFVALPYGARTDWAKNVLASGEASFMIDGHSIAVDRPQVIPMAEATTYFGAKEQRLHYRFHVESALRIHRA